MLLVTDSLAFLPLLVTVEALGQFQPTCRRLYNLQFLIINTKKKEERENGLNDKEVSYLAG